MTITHVRKWTLALALVVIGAGVALAAVTFDLDSGTGFVGKGDVQLALGWNNKALQDNATSVQFRVETVEVQETTWTCDRDAGPQTQERAHTETKTVEGLVSSIARERNQITGFILKGYSGTPSESSTTEGPAVGSCPTGWTAINITPGEPSSVSRLQVSSDGTNWFTLLVIE